MTESNNNEYKSDSKYRGQAVIIVNNFKGAKDQDREGADKDMSNMANLFGALDFKVTAYKDLTGKQMREKIKKACGNTNNEKSDCFALVISTHGEELLEGKKERQAQYRLEAAQTWQQYLLGSDYDKVRVEDLVDDIARSKSLQDKPKLLFIQACRTKSTNAGLRTSKSEDHGIDMGVSIPIVVEKPMSGSQPSDAKENDCKSLEHLVKMVIKDGADDISKEWNKDSDPDPDEYQPDLINDTKVQDENSSGENMDALKGHTFPSTLENIEGTVTEIRNLDMIDARGAAPGTIPDLPKIEKEQPQIFDVFGLTNFPDDFLLVYPAMFGKFAFRRHDMGSRLLYLMHKNMKYLLEGKDVLQFLTHVARELSSAEIYVKDGDENTLSVKVNPCIQHRLTGKVLFRPKSENSVMVNVKRKLGLETAIKE